MPRNIRQRKGGRPPKIPDELRHFEDEEISGDSGWWTFCKLTLLVMFILPVGLLAFVLLFVASPIDPVYVNAAPRPEWTGPLEPNNILASTEHLFEKKLLGPESIVLDHGHMYTGTADGKVMHMEKGQLRELVQFGTLPCKAGDYHSEPRCGRPLGMRLDKDGYLIVMDAYLGMFKVNVATGDYQQLVSSSLEIGGARCKFFNDLDIAADGSIYFTDSSVRWQRRQFLWSLMEMRGDGRLIKHDAETNTTELLLDGLHFANGVQLSRKEDYLLVAETSIARIMKYHLKGPKRGQAEVFADNLPGLPDNIRRCRSGGYWVTIASCRKASFSLFDVLAPWPTIRKHIAKLPLQLLLPYLPKCALVLQLNEEGQIVRSLQDPDHTAVKSVSEVEDDAGVLYLGSYHAPFIGKLDLSKKT